MDVGNSPPEFSDRCLAARAPEAQLDGKQQVLVALAIGAGVRPELSRGQKVSWFLCFKLFEIFQVLSFVTNLGEKLPKLHDLT